MKANAKKSKYPSEPLEKLIEERIWNLKKDEEQLRSVFVASPDAIVVTDLNGRIVECNQAALEMFGTKANEELVGKNSLELIAEKDRERALENLKKTFEQGVTKNVEYTLTTKDGREYSAELSASVVRDASGVPTSFVGILKNITERKKVEEALSESERKYRSVVDNIAIGVSVIGSNMEIVALNRQMRRWFPNIDVSKKPICYRAFRKPPRKSACPNCPTCKTLQDGKVHESVADTPMGNRVVNFRVVSSPIKDQNGKVVAAIEMVDDVTEHKKFEEQLKQYSEFGEVC